MLSGKLRPAPRAPNLNVGELGDKRRFYKDGRFFAAVKRTPQEHAHNIEIWGRGGVVIS